MITATGTFNFCISFYPRIKPKFTARETCCRDKRTVFIELANLNRGKEADQAPCVAYSIAGLGLKLTDDPQLYKNPRLLSTEDYFFTKMTVTPLRDVIPPASLL